MEFMGLGVGEWLAIGSFVFGGIAAFVTIRSTVAANSRAIEKLTEKLEEMNDGLPAELDKLKTDLRGELSRIEAGHAERFQAVEVMISAARVEADRQREKFEDHRVEVAATYVTRDRLRESEATILNEMKSIRASVDSLSEKLWTKLESLGERAPRP